MRTEIWMVSNLPPPVHGVSVFNRSLLAEFEQAGVPIRLFRVGARSGRGIGRWQIRKAIAEGVAVLKLLGRAVAHVGSSQTVLYFTPSQGGPAVYRDLAVSELARLLCRRTVAHLHGCGWVSVVKKGGLGAAAMRRTLDNCDAVICLGETFASVLSQHVKCKCVAVNNGVPGVAGASAKKLPNATSPVVLSFLGNFIPSKGIGVAALALRELLKAGHRVVLKCAGEWRAETHEKEFLAEFKAELLSKEILMLGPLDPAAKEALLRDAHIMLLPTRYPYEGQPLALIEALSAGVVPFTTDQGGIPDIMRFSGGRRLVSAGHDSAAGLCRSVAALLSSPAEFEQLSGECLNQYEKFLTMRRCADQVLATLRPEAAPKDGVLVH